jgi:hypothetical protein
MNLDQLLDFAIESLSFGSIVVFSALFIIWSFSVQTTQLQPVATNANPAPTSTASAETADHELIADPWNEDAPSVVPMPVAHFVTDAINSAFDYPMALLAAAPVAPVSSAPVATRRDTPASPSIAPVRSPVKTTAKKALVSPTTRVKPHTPSQSEQLRKHCSAHGIKWRNAHSNGKHLTVAQMKQALGAKGVAI